MLVGGASEIGTVASKASPQKQVENLPIHYSPLHLLLPSCFYYFNNTYYSKHRKAVSRCSAIHCQQRPYYIACILMLVCVLQPGHIGVRVPYNPALPYCKNCLIALAVWRVNGILYDYNTLLPYYRGVDRSFSRTREEAPA